MRLHVYLSGGMKTEWRDEIIESCPGYSFSNPTMHYLSDPKEYTVWDFMAVRQCDVVFAYMEENNPSGIGLAAECAYAVALNKTVILVDEKQDANMAIIRSLVTVNYDSLDDGFQFLKSLCRIGE